MQHFVGNVVWEDSWLGEKREGRKKKSLKRFYSGRVEILQEGKNSLSSTDSTKQQYKLIVIFRKCY